MTVTPEAIRETLVQMIVGAAGGDEQHWRAAIGEVEELSLTMNPAGNWRVTPSGTKRGREVIEAAVKLVKEAHPYALPR